MLRLVKRLVATLLVLCVLLIVAWVFRASLLTRLANAWIISDPIAKADVIVVLGGGRETRPFEAAKLYRQGVAPRILVMNPKPEPTVELGLIPSDAELTRRILGREGVPASALVILTNQVDNSYEESVVFRDWAKAHAVKTAIIPTDIFHTRRICWLYHKELKNTDVQVRVEAVPVLNYTARDWWRNEHGVVAFQNEVLKFAYYRIKY